MNAVMLSYIRKSSFNSSNLEVMFKDLCKNTIPRNDKINTIRVFLEEYIPICSPSSININDGQISNTNKLSGLHCKMSTSVKKLF